MAHYLVVMLDDGGNRCGTMSVDQPNHDEAISAAEKLLEPDHAAEVWLAGWLIGRVMGKQVPAPRS
jgi:hypothetical protein